VALTPPPPTFDELLEVLRSSGLDAFICELQLHGYSEYIDHLLEMVMDIPVDFFLSAPVDISTRLLHRILELKANALYVVERGDHTPFLNHYLAITQVLVTRKDHHDRVFGELLYTLASLDAESNRVFYKADTTTGTYVPEYLKVAHYFNEGDFYGSLTKPFENHVQEIATFIKSADGGDQVEYMVQISILFRTVFPGRWSSEYHGALLVALR
jgi:hypothetical protein